MPAKISQDVRERQLRELAEADGYSFVGWVDGYKSSESRVIFRCQTHGEWDAMCERFVSGNRCAKCRSRLIPRDKCERQLKDIATEVGHSFVMLDGTYIGARGKAVIKCDNDHEYIVTICHFKTGTRCPICEVATRSEKNRKPINQCETEILKICIFENLEFLGWCTEYRNSGTKISVECSIHGMWEVSVNNFVNKSRRCPGCASYGYASNKSGVLYSLMSECGSMVKIGITNKFSQRHHQLISRTPFAFSVHRHLQCDDGAYPPMLERMFHNEFPSAGLSGFDGATEWRVWYPEVNTWFDLLSG